MKKQKIKKKDGLKQKQTNALVRFVLIGGLILAGLGTTAIAVAGIRQAVVQTEKEKVFSVSWDLTKDSAKGKREDDAAGMVAGINGEKNDFDRAYPWKAIHEVKDENNDVFIRIPKFYERFTITEEKISYSITANNKKGFHVAPAFIKDDEELDYIDIAKYEASLSKSGKLQSVAGAQIATDEHTLDEYRALAEADGNQLFDLRQNLALQSLFIVEFANLDSQSIMSGLSQNILYTHTLTADDIEEKTIKTLSVSAGATNLIDSDTDKVKFAKANAKHVDVYLTNGESGDDLLEINEQNVEAASIKLNASDDDIAEITLAKALNVSKYNPGDTIKVWFGAGDYHKTGETKGLKGSSVGASQKSLEVKAMSYRGVENWYGNSFTLIDGFATKDNVVYVSMDAEKNADRTAYQPYSVNVEDTFVMGTMLVNNFNMADEENPALFDTFSISYGDGDYFVGGIGGSYERNANCGAFCLGVHFGLDATDGAVRLACMPR